MTAGPPPSEERLTVTVFRATPHAFRHVKRMLGEHEYERARELLLTRHDFSEWRMAKRVNAVPRASRRRCRRSRSRRCAARGRQSAGGSSAAARAPPATRSRRPAAASRAAGRCGRRAAAPRRHARRRRRTRGRRRRGRRLWARCDRAEPRGRTPGLGSYGGAPGAGGGASTIEPVRIIEPRARAASTPAQRGRSSTINRRTTARARSTATRPALAHALLCPGAPIAHARGPAAAPRPADLHPRATPIAGVAPRVATPHATPPPPPFTPPPPPPPSLPRPPAPSKQWPPPLKAYVGRCFAVCKLSESAPRP